MNIQEENSARYFRVQSEREQTLGVNLGKILANKNLARQSWLFIQDTCKILRNIFSGVPY